MEILTSILRPQSRSLYYSIIIYATLMNNRWTIWGHFGKSRDNKRIISIYRDFPKLSLTFASENIVGVSATAWILNLIPKISTIEKMGKDNFLLCLEIWVVLMTVFLILGLWNFFIRKARRWDLSDQVVKLYLWFTQTAHRIDGPSSVYSSKFRAYGPGPYLYSIRNWVNGESASAARQNMKIWARNTY